MTEDTQTDYAPAWRPDQNDPKTVKGQVVDLVMGPDFGWGPYPIVTIRQEDGSDLAIHVQAAVLRSELAKRRVGRGDDLEVTYLGQRPPKSGTGKPYHFYRVLGGKEPEFSWGDDAAQAGPADRQEDLAEPPIASALAAPDPDPMAAEDDDDVPF
jgi:hypothetical protein